MNDECSGREKMVWMESLNRVKTREQVLPPGIQAVGQQWKEKQIYFEEEGRKKEGGSKLSA